MLCLNQNATSTVFYKLQKDAAFRFWQQFSIIETDSPKSHAALAFERVANSDSRFQKCRQQRIVTRGTKQPFFCLPSCKDWPFIFPSECISRHHLWFQPLWRDWNNVFILHLNRWRCKNCVQPFPRWLPKKDGRNAFTHQRQTQDCVPRTRNSPKGAQKLENRSCEKGSREGQDEFVTSLRTFYNASEHISGDRFPPFALSMALKLCQSVELELKSADGVEISKNEPKNSKIAVARKGRAKVRTSS